MFILPNEHSAISAGGADRAADPAAGAAHEGRARAHARAAARGGPELRGLRGGEEARRARGARGTWNSDVCEPDRNEVESCARVFA